MRKAKAKFSAGDEFSEDGGQTYPVRGVVRGAFRCVEALQIICLSRYCQQQGYCQASGLKRHVSYTAKCYKSDKF